MKFHVMVSTIDDEDPFAMPQTIDGGIMSRMMQVQAVLHRDPDANRIDPDENEPAAPEAMDETVLDTVETQVSSYALGLLRGDVFSRPMPLPPGRIVLRGAFRLCYHAFGWYVSLFCCSRI